MKQRLQMLGGSALIAAGGLAWWVAPGAGLLLLGALGIAFSLLYDDGRGGGS